MCNNHDYHSSSDSPGCVCPYCMARDGKVIGLKENFFVKGDSQTIGGQTQHYNYDDVTSNPLHDNCRCTLLPVR